MAIPKSNAIQAPALKLLVKHDSLEPKQFVAPLAKSFNLTDKELDQEYPESSVKIFYDRVTWALSFLYRSGLALKPKRGRYQISEKGRELLGTSDENIQKYIDENYKPTEKYIEKIRTLEMQKLSKKAKDESAEDQAKISDAQRRVGAKRVDTRRGALSNIFSNKERGLR